MAKDMFWTIVTFATIGGVLALAFWPSDNRYVVVKYDCRQLIGGWHPDMPIKVQEECRKRRSEK